MRSIGAVGIVLLMAGMISAQTASKPLSIVVAPADVVITTTALPGGKVGVAYSAALTATGGVQPYSWSVTAGTMPGGLFLSPAGQITGTPVAAGTANFTITVKDATLSASHSVDVKWNASTAPGITGYNVYRDAIKIGNAIGVTFNDPNVTSGSTYLYQVTAAIGTTESPKSNSATAVIP